MILILSQLGKLLGLSIGARKPLSQLWEALGELGSISGLTLALSAASLGILLALRMLMPRLPAALVVVVVAIGLSWAVDLQAHGVAVVGAIPAGLPSFDFPTPAWNDVLHVVPAAVGIFFVSFADEILTARSFAGKHNQHVRASQELLAMGAANAAAGVTQGFSVGASGSRTAVNDSMGARSQVAGLFAAGTVLVILLFLTQPVQYLPKAVLGAVIVFAALGLVDPQAWRALAAVDNVEVAIAGVTAGCVIVFGVLEALVVAVGLSVIDTVRRSARPHDAVLGWVDDLGRYADVALWHDARVTPGVVVYRLDDRLFFANAVLRRPCARGDSRSPTSGEVSRLRRGGRDTRRLDRARSARPVGEGSAARRDHSHGRPAADTHRGTVRRCWSDRDDRQEPLLPDDSSRRGGVRQPRGRGVITSLGS